MSFVKLLRAQFIARRIFPEGATVEVDDALAAKLLERLDAAPVELTAEEPSPLDASEQPEAATVATPAPSLLPSAPQREPVPKAARAKKGKRGR